MIFDLCQIHADHDPVRDQEHEGARQVLAAQELSVPAVQGGLEFHVWKKSGSGPISNQGHYSIALFLMYI